MATTKTSGRLKQIAKASSKTTSSEQLIKEIHRNTRKIFTSEQKVLIVM